MRRRITILIVAPHAPIAAEADRSCAAGIELRGSATRSGSRDKNAALPGLVHGSRCRPGRNDFRGPVPRAPRRAGGENARTPQALNLALLRLVAFAQPGELLPELPRRKDWNVFDRAECKQRFVPGDEDIGSGGDGTSKDRNIVCVRNCER